MQEKEEQKTKNRQLFSERFRKLRKDLKLSQREMSDLLELTGNTQVSKFENGTSEPSIEILRRLEPLSIDLHRLITGNLSANTKEAIKLLKPFIYSYLSTITKKIQDMQERCDFIRKDTTFAVMHNMAIDAGQKSEFLNLDTQQKKIEELHQEYKTITDEINKVLEKFGEKI